MSEITFQGVVINASFPRSGHRFLRELCMGYFAKEMRFFDSYSQNTIINGKLNNNAKRSGNYIKTHDFDLHGVELFKEKFPLRRKYLVQIRHPLASIASYYEFALKNNEVKQDSLKNWLLFLEEKLIYWKRFCEKWLVEEKSSILLVTYEELYASTESELKRVIQFISGHNKVDEKRLATLIDNKSFNQYVGEDNSVKERKRDVTDFKYFNDALFKQIEGELDSRYLSPLGIKCLFS